MLILLIQYFNLVQLSNFFYNSEEIFYKNLKLVLKFWTKKFSHTLYQSNL